ncbi:response regulator [Paenibacillus luteus]|uniref:response regulator n=1 Tax=Paenibacillus luteus TaxID=2545753 RepID=UPI0011444252|nr:response regulator [Paenibacillus luteus]
MLKLIIVDDELLMRIGLRSLIHWEEHGFQIVGEASNGKEALEIAAKASPDLIITDVRMPTMDGLELIRETSKFLKNCKYVILSNFDEFRYVKEAMQLGASDYLIKCEIKPDILAQLLSQLRQQYSHLKQHQLSQLPEDYYKQSLTYLKEVLFKEAISGLKSEQDIIAKVEPLNIRLRPAEMVIAKIKIEHFEEVQKKYVEKDEKLLRFSIVNVLEEIIPNKWSREIVVESSSEYLVIMNTIPEVDKSLRAELDKLCVKIIRSIKDFVNLRVSIGMSTPVQGYRYIKLAYQEASLALQQSFYTGAGQVLYFEEISKHPNHTGPGVSLSRNQEHEYQNIIESKNVNRLHAFMEDVWNFVHREQASAEEIRGIYISLIETVNTYLSITVRSRFLSDDKSLYETILKVGTWEEIHFLVLDYVLALFESESKNSEQLTYADMAIQIMDRYYNTDISLQSVAKQINVNPSYLSRIFKQETGMNFVSYLTGIRINKAKLLLENKQLKVYEVAEKIGYHNYSYFSRIFKKVVGVSPEEYRG